MTELNWVKNKSMIFKFQTQPSQVFFNWVVIKYLGNFQKNTSVAVWSQSNYTATIKGQDPGADILVVALIVKIDDATFEVNITNNFQDITKKQFQWQLRVPPHRQTFLHHTFMDENYFTLLMKYSCLSVQCS